MEKTWDIIGKGRMHLSKELRKFKMQGYIDKMDFYGYKLDDNGLTGIARFGLRLRGYTAGNINLEVPLAFDAGQNKFSIPVICYMDGETFNISQEFFDNLLGQVNLVQTTVPDGGWMSPDKSNLGTYIRMNPANKYASTSDKSMAMNHFLLCLGATRTTLKDAAINTAIDMLHGGIKIDDAMFRLLAIFLPRLSMNDLTSVVQGVYGGRVGKRLAFDEDAYDIPTSLYDMVEAEEAVEEYDESWRAPYQAPYVYEPEKRPYEEPAKVIDITEGPVQELPVVLEPAPQGREDVEIIVPESYDQVIYPTAAQLQQLIKLYRVIRFSYRKLNGEFTMREVEPHYLWLTKKRNIIMISWDYQRNDWRGFDIARVRDVDVSHYADWKNLGEFMAIVDKANEKGLKVPINYRDIYKPRGPYHENVVDHRGSRMGSVLGNQFMALHQFLSGLDQLVGEVI